MILTDELCDKLCAAAREKSKEMGIDISFAISDENGLPRAYRRYGEGGSLMAIQTNDPKITARG